MDDEKTIETDISSYDFESWIKFVFDHPIARPPFQEWYENSSEEFIATNPQRLLEHFTQLCLRFPEVASRYSLEQINQGIWFLLSRPIYLGEHLVNSSIPITVRITCIRSMFHVFSDFVARSKIRLLENSFDMWWDFICHDFWIELPFREIDHEAVAKALEAGKSWEEAFPRIREMSYEDLNDEDQSVLDVILETLVKILQLKDERCAQYALHGLGHLHHPSVKNLVQGFIEANKETMPKESMAWVEACRDGKVM